MNEPKKITLVIPAALSLVFVVLLIPAIIERWGAAMSLFWAILGSAIIFGMFFLFWLIIDSIVRNEIRRRDAERTHDRGK